MKKIFAVILAFVLALSLISCANVDSPKTDDIPTITPDVTVDEYPDEFFLEATYELDNLAFTMYSCNYNEGAIHLFARIANDTNDTLTVSIDNVTDDYENYISLSEEYIYEVPSGTTELVFSCPFEVMPEAVFFTLNIYGSSGEIYCADEGFIFFTTPIDMSELNDLVESFNELDAAINELNDIF